MKKKIQNENSSAIKSVPFFLNKGAKIGIFRMGFLTDICFVYGGFPTIFVFLKNQRTQ
ncbi:MAG: hypothetical protein AB8G86_12550 [Saprospiraceae bacterium]